MSQPTIRVVPDLETIAREAADRIIDVAGRAIADHGQFSIALSGGSTPKALYQLLAEPSYQAAIEWGKTQVYFSDERCVPPSHAESNFHMADEALLSVLSIPPENIHRMKGEIDPRQAADEYEALLRKQFDVAGLDVALLGMGEDGHTASIFPGTAAVDETVRDAMANYVEKLSAWRLTMTAPFLNRSDNVLVLVAGANKTQILQAVLESEPDPRQYPIRLINPSHGQFLWLVDAAAAGMA